MNLYSLHDTEGNDLGLIEHPAPNLEPGYPVTTEDGRHWRVVRYVPAPEEAPVRRLLGSSHTILPRPER